MFTSYNVGGLFLHPYYRNSAPRFGQLPGDFLVRAAFVERTDEMMGNPPCFMTEVMLYCNLIYNAYGMSIGGAVCWNKKEMEYVRKKNTELVEAS